MTQDPGFAKNSSSNKILKKVTTQRSTTATARSANYCFF